MTILEQVAYLKGLFDGMEYDEKSQEGKLFKGVFDVLEDMALAVTDLEDQAAILEDDVDILFEELEEMEDDLFGDDCDCGDLREAIYEVQCPTCKEAIYLDEELLEAGEIKCPSCGEELDLDLTELEEEA